MRINVELDDELASRLEEEARRLGFSVSQALNYFLRVGLDSVNRQQKNIYKVTPFKLGLPPGLSYDCVAELIEYLEGPYHL